MSTPDYPDWTQPVSQIEQVSTLYQSNAINLPGGSTGQMDTSRAQTIIGSFVPDSTPAAGPNVITFDWDLGTGTAVTDIITVWDINDTPAAGGCTFRIPVRGSRLNVFWSANDPTVRTAALTLVQSNRAEPEPVVYQSAQNPGRLMIATGTVGVLAGQTQIFKFGPVARAISLSMFAGAANGRIELRGANSNGATLAVVSLGTWVPAGQFVVVPAIPLPFTALEVLLENLTGATMNMIANIWDVS